eukprot:TRINITY_DN1877_c0_g1_i1.p1 TRINITY_DN1877_c0_g1~~TRINITY_DN1877_c0_g1_i1.p1  ORF type:complete len:368 (-),score=94.76 TRINITY_DN1877_c0_g1_i1:148-1251(-)
MLRSLVGSEMCIRDRFKGCAHFRHRIVCATLSGRTITISDIRAEDEHPGLRDFEVSFLRMIERVTNGCGIKINSTGTKLGYKPGVLIGGHLAHECGKARGIGWFVEGLLPIALFCKEPLHVSFTGITNHELDLSVDVIRTVTLPFLHHFGIDEGLDFKIKRRGSAPEGGGEVIFKCPNVKELKPIDLVNETKIRRIRGIAFAAGMSAQVTNRLVDSCKSLLTQFTGDVFIFTDHQRGPAANNSPGFGISVVAESSKRTSLSVDVVGSAGALPEDVGLAAAQTLCDEVARGGCIDSSHQSLVFLLMTLCPEDVSRVRIGELTEYSAGTLRSIRDFFGVMFKMTPDPETGTIVMACRGVGYRNLARKTS